MVDDHKPASPSEAQSPKRQQSEGRSATRESLIMLGRLSGLWAEILASIIGLGACGFILDRWLNTEPWFTVVGLMLGAIGGVYNSARKAMLLTRSEPRPPRSRPARTDVDAPTAPMVDDMSSKPDQDHASPPPAEP